MTELHSRALMDLAPPDLREHLSHDDTILIPLGSVEMHGDHMPLGTDIYNAVEVCRRAAEKADTVYAPPIWTGYSPQHLREPNRGMGTITMRSHTIESVIHDTARSLIHHGFNRLIFVNGHTSNTKVTDPIMRNLRYETGALIAMFKPYGERYLGLIEDLMENPPEETPGWHASEQETSIMMAYNAANVRMDRAVSAKAHAPAWLPEAFGKEDGAWDAQFKGYEYFYFPMDHNEFADRGVIGNPLRATAEKGDAIFDRFSTYLAEAVAELRTVPVEIISREFVLKA
ncbi:MAG TPA: creatininase family protein [Solirubrobacteraceae bacterium]|jgi:creatinine amidohydrolase|nr:creatininase family protein [Solirubrobacteraceae bacterium]